jgi:hypothetical protein
MKLFRILKIFYLLVPALLVSAQSQNETLIAEEFATIPACAVSPASPKLTGIPVNHSSSSQLECLSYTVPEVGCTLANTTCLCASQELITITAKCMLAKCTIVEGVGECWRSDENSTFLILPELDKAQAAICEHPYRSRNQLIGTKTIVCATVTYTAVIVRLLTRHCLHQKYGLDDWFIIAAAVRYVFIRFVILANNSVPSPQIWSSHPSEFNVSIGINPQPLTSTDNDSSRAPWFWGTRMGN